MPSQQFQSAHALAKLAREISSWATHGHFKGTSRTALWRFFANRVINKEQGAKSDRERRSFCLLHFAFCLCIRKSYPGGTLLKCLLAYLVKARLLRETFASLTVPPRTRRPASQFHSANAARNETEPTSVDGKHRAGIFKSVRLAHHGQLQLRASAPRRFAVPSRSPDHDPRRLIPSFSPLPWPTLSN